MRMGLTLQTGERAVDVLIDGPAGTAFAEVTEGLCAIGGVRRGTPLWCAGMRLHPDTPIGVPPLIHGAVVHAGEAGHPAVAASTRERASLLVVSGPDAGTVRPLPQGTLRVGRSVDAELRLCDPDVSREHALLTVHQDGVTIADLGSANGTTVNGGRVGADPIEIRPGDLLRTGESMLTLAEQPLGLACTRSHGDGHVAVNTPPRIPGPQRRAHVAFPAEPTPPPTMRFQPVAVAVPLLIAIPAALWWGPTMLLFLVLSPVLMLANHFGDRVNGRRTRRREHSACRVESAAAEARLADLLCAEARVRRDEMPDPASVAIIAAGPGPRLWERTGTAPTVRLGLATLPARVTVAGRLGDAVPPVVPDVPVIVDLGACGALGVAGPRARVLDIARAIVLQLAVAHSPADVEITVLRDADADADWTWTRWLPHLDTVGPGRPGFGSRSGGAIARPSGRSLRGRSWHGATQSGPGEPAGAGRRPRPSRAGGRGSNPGGGTEVRLPRHLSRRGCGRASDRVRCHRGGPR